MTTTRVRAWYVHGARLVCSGAGALVLVELCYYYYYYYYDYYYYYY